MAPAAKLILFVICLIEAGDLQANRWGILYRQAFESFDRGDFASAKSIAERAYRHWQTSPGSRWYWPFRLILAESLIEDDQLVQASPLLTTRAPAPGWEARRLVAIAFVDFRNKDHVAARSALDSAEAINPKDARDVAGKIELIRGNIYLREYNHDEAEACFRRGLASVEGTGSLTESLTLTGFGVGDLRFFRNDQAVAWFERARAVAEHFGKPRGVILADFNLGVCYVRLGDLARALQYLDEAAAMAQKLGDHVNLARVRVAMGQTAFELGDSAMAENYLKEALRLASPGKDDEWVSTSFDDLSYIASARGDLEAATRLNQQSAEAAERSHAAHPILAEKIQAAQIAAAHRDYAGAEKLFAGALDAATKLDDPLFLWQCHAGIAALYRDTGRIAESGREYQSAISIIDEQWAELQKDDSKLSFLSNLIRFYDNYVDFLLKTGDKAGAFRVAQSCRARLLEEKAHSGRPQEAALDLGSLQAALRASDSTLLSYWLAPARSLVWVFDGRGLQDVLALPPEAEISAHVRQYGDALLRGVNPLETANAAGRWLSAKILPDSYRAPKGGNIIIQPDGALHQLNFESLPAEDGKHYWIEEAVVSVAPSLALLRASAKVSQRSLLLFGDPESAVRDLPRLPSLKFEIEAVSKHYADKQVFTGVDATPAAYRSAHAETYAALHFASHAVPNRESPLDSAIILAGPPETRKLYARDLLGQPLTAELVTLSACETAGNRAYYGEGLMGFSWAFLSAGARNVVAGLWQVDDHATAQLMARFYDAMAAGRSPAAALRQAKLELMASNPVYRKPLYWAAFETFTRALYH